MSEAGSVAPASVSLLGFTHELIGDLPAALEAHRRGLELATRTGDPLPALERYDVDRIRRVLADRLGDRLEALIEEGERTPPGRIDELASF